MAKMCVFLAVIGGIGVASPVAQAQFATPSVTDRPTLSYGYQPYDPGHPTGFNHPNDMGFGTYHNPTRIKGHRARSLNYRRFRGY